MQALKVKFLALCIAVVTVVALDGCGDPTAIQASAENTDTTRTLYALNGSPNALPSGIDLYFGLPVRLDGSFAFDVAFDLNASNEVIVYTPRGLGSQLVAARRVGLQTTTLTFEQATQAPTSGYQYDSLRTVPVGQVLFVDVIDALHCSQFSLLGQNIRAKVEIDSVNTTSRAIYVHFLSNPNCGFRSLVPGLPKD